MGISLSPRAVASRDEEEWQRIEEARRVKKLEAEKKIDSFKAQAKAMDKAQMGQKQRELDADRKQRGLDVTATGSDDVKMLANAVSALLVQMQ